VTWYRAVVDGGERGRGLFVLAVLVVVVAQFALTTVQQLFLSDFVDFDAYYTAALVVREGQDPYDRTGAFIRENGNAAVREAAERAGTRHAHEGFEHVHPFLYPPMLAFLVIPLTLAGNDVAESAWLVVNVALLAALLVVTARAVGLRSGPMLALGIVLVLGFHGVGETLALGQVNVLVACLAFAAIERFVRGRTASSSALLALSIAIKLQPALLLGYFLLVRRFRYVAACLAWLVAFHLPLLLWLGTEPFVTFVRDVVPHLAAGVPASINQSLPALLARMADALGAGSAPAVVWITRAAVVAVLAATVSLMRLAEPDHVYNASLALIATLVVSPVTWNSHLVLLLLPLFGMLKAIDDGRLRAPGPLGVAVVGYVLLAVVPPVFYDNHRLTGALAVFGAVRLYGMLLLGWCLWRAARGVRVPQAAVVAPA
jgi:hypothetical protein